MVGPDDAVLALSYSGQTQELITILPALERLNVPLVAMTGQKDSPLARRATVHLDVHVEKEAGLDIAPTASTTAMLVLGDALAITLLEIRGFSREDFAKTHPSGSLGRRLLLKVRDLMWRDERIPKVEQNTFVSEALLEMTRKTLGMTTVVDHEGNILGVFTDGDLRRSIDRGLDVKTTPIAHVMSRNFKHATADMLAFDALTLMEQYRITSLVVLDQQRKIEGVLHMHDLLRAGLDLSS